MWNEYYSPSTLTETLHLLSQKRATARLVAGATDLMLELERGLRKGITTVIDITRLPGLDQITLDQQDVIHIGPLVTHNQAVASPLLRARAFPLVSASFQVGAPQIRNRATIAGNLITASPANDTIPPLVALGAWVTLASEQGTRQVPLYDFYTGVRKTLLQPHEMLVDIAFHALRTDQSGTFLKLGLRRAQAISLVNTAVVLTLDSDQVISAVITLGAVAPTIVRATTAEAYLAGRQLTPEVITHAGELAAEAARPIDDIRGSAAYRKAMVKTLVARALRLLHSHTEQASVPESPILLQSPSHPPVAPPPASIPAGPNQPIHTTINGRAMVFAHGHEKSLLRLLRESADLVGTKEGCAEGECGACTVFLDGQAVMACLVPAGRASGAEIVTIEGLAQNGQLHPVQQAFISEGAVQCGYCTPGFIMSAAQLLAERPRPTRTEITQALTGNLCRCTGYYKIIQAVETAAKL